MRQTRLVVTALLCVVPIAASAVADAGNTAAETVRPAGSHSHPARPIEWQFVLDGTISSVGASSLTVRLHSLTPTPTLTSMPAQVKLVVGPRSSLSLDGRPARLDQLDQGDWVSAFARAPEGLGRALSAVSVRAYTPGPEGRRFLLDGTILSVGPTRLTLRIGRITPPPPAIPSPTQVVLAIRPGTSVTLGGRPAVLAELHPGDQVSALTRAPNGLDGKLDALWIHAQPAGPCAPPRECIPSTAPQAGQTAP